MEERIRVRQVIATLAITAFTRGGLSDLEHVAHIEAQDLWQAGDRGAVLIWIGPECEVWGVRRPVLSLVLGELSQDGSWQLAGANTSPVPNRDCDGALSPGLYRVLDFARAGHGPLTVAVATATIKAVRVSAGAGDRLREVGSQGFFLFAVSDQRSDVRLAAIHRDGTETPEQLQTF